MADKEMVINLSDSAIPTRSERKARLASVLSRNIIEDRLNVKGVPADLYLEWVPTDPVEIARKEALGYRLCDSSDDWIAGIALHNDGTGKSQIGDVVAMVCPKEHRELINEVTTERAASNTSTTRNKGEAEFTNRNNQSGPGKTIQESRVEKVQGVSEILDRVK